MSTARKAGRLHRLALGTALVAAAAAPLAVAIPASAATTAHGCTVRPLKPTAAGVNGAGVKQVDYEVLYTCAGGRAIEVQQYFMEDDAPPNTDDVTGPQQLTTRTFGGTNIFQRTTTRTLANTEGGREEVYQKTRFRVSVGGGAFSAWTAFEKGPNLSIAN
jgi:hypothetical protein